MTPVHLQLANQKLFMSYGLLSRLTNIVGGADQVPLLAGNVETQEHVILEVFTIRDKKTITFEPTSLDELEVTLDEVSLVLDWVGGHITDFFLKTTLSSIKRADEMQASLSALAPTKNGSSASPSLTPAA